MVKPVPTSTFGNCAFSGANSGGSGAAASFNASSSPLNTSIQIHKSITMKVRSEAQSKNPPRKQAWQRGQK
jgi:hypothetical protein